MSRIQFLFFDLGKVLLDFDVPRMCNQISEVASIPPERVAEILYNHGLQRRYEQGQIDDAEFYEEFCKLSGTRPPADALRLAASDIFELNVPIVRVVAALSHARIPIGILSNTCNAHWQHVAWRFSGLLGMFPIRILSYEVGSMKPDIEIYKAASEAVAVPPENIFFVDDRIDNVEGALKAGFDAVQFRDVSQLLQDLSLRAIRANW